MLLGVAAPAFAQSHGRHGGFGASMGGYGRGGAPGGWGRGGPGAGPGREGMQRGGGWDDRRFNGYWVGGRWYYGAPPQPAFQTPGFRPGFTPWRRGAFLPPNYQSYVLDDYWRYHLRRPPYGYHWVQVGNEFLLISGSTGLIFDVVTGF